MEKYIESVPVDLNRDHAVSVKVNITTFQTTILKWHLLHLRLISADSPIYSRGIGWNEINVVY